MLKPGEVCKALVGTKLRRAVILRVDGTPPAPILLLVAAVTSTQRTDIAHVPLNHRRRDGLILGLTNPSHFVKGCIEVVPASEVEMMPGMVSPDLLFSLLELAGI